MTPIISKGVNGTRTTSKSGNEQCYFSVTDQSTQCDTRGEVFYSRCGKSTEFALKPFQLGQI